MMGKKSNFLHSLYSGNPRVDIPSGSESRRDTTDTREEVQNGPMPERIDRLKFANNRGTISGNGDVGFPVNQDTVFVGHIPTFVKSRDVTPQPGNSFDDHAFIPAPQSGNPLP